MSYSSNNTPLTEASTTERGSPTTSSYDEYPSHPLEYHNKRLSMVSGVPAQVSTDSPDVHVSLVQPGGAAKSPFSDEAHEQSSLLATTQDRRGSCVGMPSDYFSSMSSKDLSAQSSGQNLADGDAATLSRQTTQSSENSTRNNPEHFYTESSLEHRLATQRESIAVASAHHTATPRGDRSSAPRRSRLRRSLTEHPSYPNQSLAALSTQIYPENHHAPYSSRPEVGRHGVPQPASVLSHVSSPSNSGDERHSCTVGNTPIQSPRLFSPSTARHHPVYSTDGESPMPSPYLHPVQPQAPKETNKALRDFDTYSGRKTINEYEILHEIGKGTHGKVKLARNSQSRGYVAIKIVQRYSKKRRLGKAPSQEDKVKREIAILKKAMHPNLVSMIEVIDDPDLHKIYLVLEFCEAHDVKWREIGASDIVLLESQRLKHEQEGGYISEPIEADRLMRIARTRQGRTFSRQHPRLSRINSESYFWSLEYGPDSEPEEDDHVSDLPPSRVSSHGDRYRLRHSSAQLEDDSTVLDTAMRGKSPEASPSSSHLDRPLVNEASPHQLWDSENLHEERHRRVQDTMPTQGECTRGRQSSLAESSSSRLTEILENSIPEDMRYVPLLTVSESRKAFRDALLGLEYLHYQGVIHRDIKPENLLRKADHHVKISDFGVSYLGKPIREGRESEETSDAEGSEYHDVEADLAKTVGTPAFYAPELCDLTFTEDKPRVTGQIDVWALGVTLYCFLFARLPFQAEGQFEMMRKITEDDIFVSRKRLKAVDVHARSHCGSRGPQFRTSKDHRLPHEILYDDVDDDLYNLLKRLLTKDPAERITVREIKHHPWVLEDIVDKAKWLDDTDPNRFLQGRKIEISTKEIHEAVAPLRLVERAKSVVKKAFGFTGFGGHTRKRGQSSAACSDVSSGSPGAYPIYGPTGTQTSSRSDDSISVTWKTSREQHHHHQSHPEHPLSQSVTASPELSTVDKIHNLSLHAQAPPADLLARGDYGRERPIMPNRQESVLSTTGSVRTIKQSDFVPSQMTEAADDLAMQYECPSTHMFGSLGDTGRNLLRTVRSRDRTTYGGRSTSSAPYTKSSEAVEHLQGQPSVALTSTSASGQLSHVGEACRSPRALHRKSVGSITQGHDVASKGMADILLEHAIHINEESGNNVIRPSALAQAPSFLQLSPSGPSYARSARPPAVSSNSSDEHFDPAISRETSFPSVPSVISADSSVEPDPEHTASTVDPPKRHADSSTNGPSSSVSSFTAGNSVAPRPLKLTSSDDFRSGEVETDEDDSESEDDFLAMKRTKPKKVETPTMSVRSGSTNTLKKRRSSEITPIREARPERAERGRQKLQG